MLMRPLRNPCAWRVCLCRGAMGGAGRDGNPHKGRTWAAGELDRTATAGNRRRRHPGACASLRACAVELDPRAEGLAGGQCDCGMRIHVGPSGASAGQILAYGSPIAAVPVEVNLRCDFKQHKLAHGLMAVIKRRSVHQLSGNRSTWSGL